MVNCLPRLNRAVFTGTSRLSGFQNERNYMYVFFWFIILKNEKIGFFLLLAHVFERLKPILFRDFFPGGSSVNSYYK